MLLCLWRCHGLRQIKNYFTMDFWRKIKQIYPKKNKQTFMNFLYVLSLFLLIVLSIYSILITFLSCMCCRPHHLSFLLYIISSLRLKQKILISLRTIMHNNPSCFFFNHHLSIWWVIFVFLTWKQYETNEMY